MALFERSSEPLAGHRIFVRRVLLYLGFSVVILLASLGIGVLGYHYTEGMSWLDSLLNASMILGGMGPVDTLHTAGGKLFASLYALFAGVVFLVAVGVLIAPVFHRFMHSFQFAPEDVQEAEDEDRREQESRRRR
jgi:hypothetical protein